MNANETPTCMVCHAPSGDDAWLCRTDTDRLRTMLAEMPGLLAEVRVTIARQDHISPSSSPSRRPVVEDDWRMWPHMRDRPDLGAKVQALPLHDAAVAFHIDALNSLMTWAWHLAESRGHARPDLADVNAVCAWLLRAVPSIRLDEGAGELFRDVRQLSSKANAVVDAREQRVYLGPCAQVLDPNESDGEACCTLDVYAAIGAEQIVCDGWSTRAGTGCGAKHTVAGKHLFLRAQAEDAHLRWSDLVAALPDLSPGPVPPAALLRAWKSRGERELGDLRPVSVDRNGVSLWRGGDFLAAVEQWRELGRKAGMGRRTDLRKSA